MAQPNFKMQLSFLKDSAHLMNRQSPSTSAHLMTVHNQIILDQSNSLTASQQRESCPTCGTIRVPGVTCKVFTRSQTTKQATHPRRRRKNKSPSQQTTSCSAPPKSGVVYECMQCHRETVQNLQKPPRYIPKSGTRAVATPSKASSSTSQTIPPQQPEMNRGTTKPNVGSKKRTKARNRQGLLASLAAGKQQSQSQSASSNSLDLLDFLKSS